MSCSGNNWTENSDVMEVLIETVEAVETEVSPILEHCP